MLRIYHSTDRKENTGAMLRRVAELAGQGIGGLLLVVPEQFSHMTERALCRAGGDGVCRYAEVLGFSRLATRVFAQCGGSADSETDQAGRLLIMALAVEQVKPRLKLFAASVTKPEFLLRLLDTFEEFRAWCLRPEQLRRAAGQLGGALAVKLEELALLMDSYDAACAQLGQNPDSRLTRLLQALEGGEFARDKRFFFDAFTDFNGIEQQILAQLLADGAQVEVCLQFDSLESRQEQFATARRTARSLLQLARQQEVECQLLALPQCDEDTPLRRLRAGLFGGRLQPWQEPQQTVRFLLAQDSVQLCRQAVGQMLALRAQGLRWREISVACANFETDRPILASLLKRAGIPAYFAGDTGLLGQNVVHMLLDALSAASGGMELEEVLSCLKSGYLPLDRPGCDRLEQYLRLWDLRGSRLAGPWTMHPQGLGQNRDAASDALLEQINADGRRALGPLLGLRRELQEAANTGHMVLALHRFMERIGLARQLERQAGLLQQQGKLQKAQELRQVYELICGLLEQIYGVLGRTLRPAESFLQLFRSALGCSSVGTIPASLDCVSVGSLLSQRHGDSSVLFLLGAQEGAFPSGAPESSLLTDHERLGLLRLGIGLNPTAAGRLDRELAAIDSVLQLPRQALYLGAVEKKEAYLFHRARRLLPQSPVICDDRELLRRCPREYETLPGAAPRLAQAAAYGFGSLSEQAVRALYGSSLRLSSSKIDCLAGCKLKYFLEYGLKARENKTAQLDPSLYGTFVHDVLEHTARQVMEEGGFDRVSLQRVLQIAQERMELLAQTMLGDLWSSARAEYLFRRSFDEVRTVVEDLYRELSVSDFAPRWFELHFAPGADLPAVHIAGEKISAQLEGFVDRVDTWQKDDTLYVRVVDYKTGKKSFSYTNVLHGLGLQMLLYLFALSEQGAALSGSAPEPAGVLYFPARVEKSSLAERPDALTLEERRRKARRRSGLLLDEAPVLQAMEPCGDEPSYLPYKTRGGSREGDLASREQLRQLAVYVRRTVSRLADTLAGGSVAPEPYFTDKQDNACAWCPYGSVCRGKVSRRVLKKISKSEEFWKEVEQENAGDQTHRPAACSGI